MLDLYTSRCLISPARRDQNRESICNAHRRGGDSSCSAEALLSSITDIDSADLLENDLEASLISNPTSYEEAINGPTREEWKRATMEEWNAILENDTFEVFTDYHLKPNLNEGTMEIENHTPIQVPFDIKPIGSKWVYRTKRNPDGTTRYKVCLVVKGWQQIQGVNYNETFAPVSKLTTLHLLLVMAWTKWPYRWHLCMLIPLFMHAG
jgi:hypothetical protein